MQRWAAGVEYCGTRYSGWQRQADAPSVQQEVERALSAVADHPIKLSAAGRTDAGVHAYNQVVHFDSHAVRSAHAWVLGSNSQLPPDVSLRWVQPVAPVFHARYGALARRYRYVILTGRSRSGLLAGRVARCPLALDVHAMHRSAQALVGAHDFTSYRDADCQAKSPVRSVHSLIVQQRGEFVTLDIRANAFLHHMVRNIAGVLMAIGQGRRHEDWAREVLELRDRKRGGVTAEACGLYFIGPEYPAEFALPAQPEFWFP